MVLLSDDSLTDGSVIRNQNQNGSCSSSGASVLPLKWKPRKVSAVRDFPQGCGPIVQPGSQEANPSSSLINNNNQANDTETMDTKVNLLQKGDNQAMLKDEISDPVNAVVEVDDNGGSVIKESIRKMKLRQRRVFAVRDFPPYCGLNATEPSEEERVVINGKRSFGIEDTL